MGHQVGYWCMGHGMRGIWVAMRGIGMLVSPRGLGDSCAHGCRYRNIRGLGTCPHTAVVAMCNRRWMMMMMMMACWQLTTVIMESAGGGPR